MGCLFLLQGIFPIQGLNPGLQHCKQTILPSEPPVKLSNITEVKLTVSFVALVAPLLTVTLRGLEPVAETLLDVSAPWPRSKSGL